MMRKLLICALAAICCACEKDNFTISVDELEGTYWSEWRHTISGYKDGKKYHYDSNQDEIMSGGFVPSVWHFSGGDILVYHDGDYYPNPSSYYTRSIYHYDPQKHVLQIGDSEYKVLQFTPDKLVFQYDDNYDNNELTITRYRMSFEPSDEWLRKVSQYPSYDELQDN